MDAGLQAEMDRRFQTVHRELEASTHLVMTLMDERNLRYEQRFDAQEEAVGAALLAAKEAVTKAEVATEKRFDSVNEFRAQQTEILATTVPREVFDAKFNGMQSQIDILRSRIDVGPPQLQQLIARDSVERGKSEASDQWIARLIALGAVLIAAGTLIAFIIRG